jgi:peptide/nickel transport system ATP-binding protein
MSQTETWTAGEREESTIMRVRDLEVYFEMSRGRSQVVDGIDLDLRRNEILGVVGESGSGKSMLASSLLDAVVDPGVTNGEVTYVHEDGSETDVFGLSKQELKEFRWETVSMVFQGAMSSFNPVTDIRTHFEETLIAHEEDLDEGIERAREIIGDLHLDPERVLDSYPHELSGGMKQRALIALSLVLEPEVLVMDEPTAALDLLMQRSIITLINEIKEKYDLSIVFITHDLPLITGLADRLAVMYAFQLVERGPTRAVVKNSAHPYTRALLMSTPNLETPLEEMRPVEGSAPDPINVPPGCAYHTRCPLATDVCEAEDPDPYDVTDDHEANCHHWEETLELEQ